MKLLLMPSLARVVSNPGTETTQKGSVFGTLQPIQYEPTTVVDNNGKIGIIKTLWCHLRR